MHGECSCPNLPPAAPPPNGGYASAQMSEKVPPMGRVALPSDRGRAKARPDYRLHFSQTALKRFSKYCSYLFPAQYGRDATCCVRERPHYSAICSKGVFHATFGESLSHAAYQFHIRLPYFKKRSQLLYSEARPIPTPFNFHSRRPSRHKKKRPPFGERPSALYAFLWLTCAVSGAEPSPAHRDPTGSW